MSDVEIIGTPERTVTRRKFIMGVIAAGATTSSVGYLFKGPQPLLGALAVQGSVERLMTLNVNGQQRRVDVMKQETLAFTLRYKLGLTGTKLGCDRAECGACTVLIDGVNSYSCSVLTHTVRGKKYHDHRGPRGSGRHVASGPAGGPRRRRLPVRLLCPGLHYEHGGDGRGQPEPDS